MIIRKALSAFLTFTILIISVLFAYPLGIFAEGVNRVTAQTNASVAQGNYGYCYVYIDDASAVASLNVSVYYDSTKITVDESYNQIACMTYDSSITSECVQYTYLFKGEGSSSKSALFYFRYRVKDDAAVGGTLFDIVVNEAYDSTLQILPVSGSRCNLEITEKKQVLSCSVYGTNSSYSSINNEFVIHYTLSTAAIAAGSVLIQYDSDLFEVAEVLTGSFFDNKAVDINTNLNGAVSVSFSGTKYSSGSQFLSIRFKVIKNIETQSTVKMTAVEFYDLDLNKINCPTMETKVYLSFDSAYTGDAPKMYVNAQYIDTGKVVAMIYLQKDSCLGAGDFKLDFDTSILEYESSTNLFAPDFFIINDKKVDMGELKFSIISMSDITDATNVMVVVFNVKHNCAGTTTALQLSGNEVSDSLTKPIALNFSGTDVIIPPAETYSEWQSILPPTCESIGYETRICTVCNNVQVREVQILGHDMKPSAEIAPTCTTPGVTAGTKCSRCDYSTCTEIPALKHSLTQFEAKPQSCTEVGWNAYEKCSRCDYTTYVEIPKIEHKYISVVVKPDYKVEGYTLHTCEVCGGSYKDNFTEALSYLPGDIDGNGVVDASDSTRILKYITGYDVEVIEVALDVNRDGKVNILDAVTILLYLSGKNVELN